MTELEQVLSEYNSLGINQQLDYDKFYLYSIITHSNAIEGSTVTEIENQLLFDEGITSSKRTIAEHLENIKEQITQYKKSMQDDTLNIRNDTLNDTLKLTEKENIVLKLIQSNLNITSNQIVQISGFSRPTVMRAIKSLKEKKLLERLDSKKTGSWKVNSFPFS